MVHSRSELLGPEEVHRVEVRDVHPPGVGGGALASVLLDVHAEEADVGAVDLLEGEKGLGPVGKLRRHVSRVDEPALHAGLDLYDLVAGGDHSDGYLARARLLLLQKVVNAGLDVRAELRSRQPLRAEFVVLALRAPLFEAVITGVSRINESKVSNGEEEVKTRFELAHLRD